MSSPTNPMDLANQHYDRSSDSLSGMHKLYKDGKTGELKEQGGLLRWMGYNIRKACYMLTFRGSSKNFDASQLFQLIGDDLRNTDGQKPDSLSHLCVRHLRKKSSCLAAAEDILIKKASLAKTPLGRHCAHVLAELRASYKDGDDLMIPGGLAPRVEKQAVQMWRDYLEKVPKNEGAAVSSKELSEATNTLLELFGELSDHEKAQVAKAIVKAINTKKDLPQISNLQKALATQARTERKVGDKAKQLGSMIASNCFLFYFRKAINIGFGTSSEVLDLGEQAKTENVTLDGRDRLFPVSAVDDVGRKGPELLELKINRRDAPSRIFPDPIPNEADKADRLKALSDIYGQLKGCGLSEEQAYKVLLCSGQFAILSSAAAFKKYKDNAGKFELDEEDGKLVLNGRDVFSTLIPDSRKWILDISKPEKPQFVFLEQQEVFRAEEEHVKEKKVLVQVTLTIPLYDPDAEAIIRIDPV